MSDIWHKHQGSPAGGVFLIMHPGRINLVALADSFETATGAIESRADENFVNLNLSGRGRGCNVPTISELKGIVEFSHEEHRPLKRCSEMLEFQIALRSGITSSDLYFA